MRGGPLSLLLAMIPSFTYYFSNRNPFSILQFESFPTKLFLTWEKEKRNIPRQGKQDRSVSASIGSGATLWVAVPISKFDFFCL